MLYFQLAVELASNDRADMPTRLPGLVLRPQILIQLIIRMGEIQRAWWNQEYYNHLRDGNCNPWRKDTLRAKVVWAMGLVSVSEVKSELGITSENSLVQQIIYTLVT